MNPTQLVNYFERISDSPEAIPRLRLFILDLAVRGKLVEQDCNDEPASADPVRIGRERREDDAPPYKIPSSWQFRNLRSISDKITDGEHATPTRILEQQVPLVTAKNVRDGFMDFSQTDWVSFETATKAWKRCRPTVGDILLVCVGATTGRLCVLRETRDMVLVRSVALIRPNSITNVDYLALALRSPMAQSQIWKKVKVSAQPCLYINRTNSLLIPVPPVPEQRRIVAKVSELMGLCDQLETAQRERQSRQDRLTASTLHHLNNDANPAAFRERAYFYVNHLRRLTTSLAHIQQLRQTILNLAVRGQLVPQNPTDEPASVLLKRIQAEKTRLIGEGKIKGHRELAPPITEEDVPFSIPSGWQWERFIGVAAIQSNLVNPSKYEDSPHIAPDNIESGTGRLLPYITIRASAVFSAKHLFFSGCILYSKIRPALAKTVIVDFDGLCSADMYPILPFISREYLHKYMLSEAFVKQSVSEDNRVAMPKINQVALSKIVVPVPPLAEQHRIVAKVTELMAVCDRLETQLTTTQNERHRLLEAVLHHALDDTLQSA
jgi:type I restriction enzyme, S subunit